MLRTAKIAASFLSTLAAISGCARERTVSITNAAPTDIKIELALEWPSYGVPSRGLPQFATVIPPGTTWSSESASRSERVETPLKMPNGVPVIRVRNPSLLQGHWQTFELQQTEGKIVVIIQPDTSDRYVLLASETPGGTPVRVNESKTEWFDD